jgi:hypothetical protein
MFVAAKKNAGGSAENVPDSKGRKYLSQSDVPSSNLEKSLRIAQTIADNYAKQPTKPLRVAQAMGIQPSSSNFRMLTGASIAYGLTDGGYNSDQIVITPLGKRIVSPVSEGDDMLAKREAVLRPRIIREFLTKYNNSRVPPERIAWNVLEEMGVPNDRTEQTYELIIESATAVGFLHNLKGQAYVDLESSAPQAGTTDDVDDEPEDSSLVGQPPKGDTPPPAPRESVPPLITGPVVSSRVFITHGKNRDIVTQLKELLTFGNFEPVVSVELESVSKPVTDKVMDEMRSCSAAIIHVGTEQRLLDPEGKEQKVLNSNVLIEIGAALALFGRKFILLVERGVALPSNLQGLYEVRYEGDRLDYDSTMRLLKAFNEFKK